MLPYYFIVCRSLTYAQRTASVLERIGIWASIQRAPAAVALEGCSHVVRVSQRNLSQALAALSRAELSPSRIFLNEAGGGYREVDF